MIEFIIYAIICITCGIFWRMGGAEGYDKLWRRIGCAIMMFSCLLINSNMQRQQMLITYAIITWGCCSYFGWINKVLAWLIDIESWFELEIEREYWWNFFAEALVIQSVVYFVSPSFKHAVVAILASLMASLGKVWIDKDKDGNILLWRKDVISEWFFGSMMCFGIVINVVLF